MKKKTLPKQTASWLLMIQENPNFKDLYIDLPSSLIKDIGWTKDDSLIWTPQSDGSFKVSKVKKRNANSKTTQRIS
jgi:hypothetical protein